MVDLANRLDSNIWLNVPHQADNTYVRAFADLVKKSLKKNLKVYLEYSNEVWLDRGDDPAGDQYDYAVAGGRGLVSAQECQAEGSRCDDLKLSRFYAQRATQIFDIWKPLLGGQLRRVVAMRFSDGGYTSRATLTYKDMYTRTDLLAVAPYFGDIVQSDEQATYIKSFTVDTYLDYLESYHLNNVTQNIRAQKAVLAEFAARGRAFPLVAYEGGQILVDGRGSAGDPEVNALFDAVNRSPRMKTLYLKHPNIWKNEGGQLYNHFLHSGKWSVCGRWGTLETLTQPRSQAPKFDALQTFMETTRRWW